MSEASEKDLTRIVSFAEKRYGQAKWHIDGKDYMSSVADEIDRAKHEIFITDWQMNPEILLKRRPDQSVTLLEKLHKKAATGKVKIYVLLYSDEWLPVGPNVDSRTAQEALLNCSKDIKKNIKVLSHPPRFSKIPEEAAGCLQNSTSPKDCAFGAFKLFIWSHHEKVVVIDRRIAFVGGIDLCYGRWDTSYHHLTEQPDHKWPGLDYCNTFKCKDPATCRHKHPRLPWHDVSCSFIGEAAEDVARHFIERYNFAIRNSSYIPTAIKSTIEKFTPQSVVDWLNSDEISLHCPYSVDHSTGMHAPHTCSCSITVLRSVGQRSIGLDCEYSILQAYCNAIKSAERFIYIENQYFISDLPICDVRNQIQSFLCERIKLAYCKRQAFHVLIVLPLKPEFEEDWQEGSHIYELTFRTYATLFLECNPNSMMSKLLTEIPREEIANYFSVYGLRTHGSLNKVPITETVYVHSKVMIVDDRKAVIGSANINDRSMDGDIDSEVCVMIEDQKMVRGKMDGKDYEVGEFSHGLRCNLVMEHLGCTKMSEVADPLSNDFRSRLFKRAANNTQIYEKKFGKLIPSDSLQTLDQINHGVKHTLSADTIDPAVTTAGICGNIVTFPCRFLQQELAEKFSKEKLAHDKGKGGFFEGLMKRKNDMLFASLEPPHSKRMHRLQNDNLA